MSTIKQLPRATTGLAAVDRWIAQVVDILNPVLRTLPTATTGGAASWHEEAPFGVIDGVNYAFTLSLAPLGKVNVYVDRLRQVQGLDFTVNGNLLLFLPGAIPRPLAIVRAEWQLT